MLFVESDCRLLWIFSTGGGILPWCTTIYQLHVPDTQQHAELRMLLLGMRKMQFVVLSWQLCVCCHGTSLSVCLSSWPRCCHDKTLKLLPWEHTDAVSVAVSRRLLRRVVMRRKMKLNKTTRKMTLLPQFLVEDIAMRCLPTALESVSRHSLFCIVYFRAGSDSWFTGSVPQDWMDQGRMRSSQCGVDALSSLHCYNTVESVTEDQQWPVKQTVVLVIIGWRQYSVEVVFIKTCYTDSARLLLREATWPEVASEDLVG